MRTIRQILGQWLTTALGNYVPTRSVSTVSASQEPPSLAPNFDAARIMSAIGAAEAGDTRDLFSIYRDYILCDSHTQAEMAKRKLAVLGDTLSVLAYDRTAKPDIQTAAAVSLAISTVPGWLDACSHLLDGSLWPVALLEKTYQPRGAGYAIAALIPVPAHLLDYSTGSLQIRDVDPATGRVLSTKHAPDAARYIVHRGHLLSAPDNWGGPMRSILFWWLLSAMTREWWSRFLERYGAPFLVGKYSREGDRSVLERAFSLAARLGGLAVSSETEVEIKQAAASDSGDAFATFLAICQREKSKLIIGQTLSAEAQPTGMNAGTSSMQEEVRQDIRRFDALRLAQTMRDNLVTQFCRINNLPGQVPRLVWGSESSREMQSAFSMLKSASDAGLRPTDAGIATLSERFGIELERASPAPPPTPFSAADVPFLLRKRKPQL